MRYEKFITRKMLRAEPKTLFVFGDNMARTGYGGQAKEMRDEPNAIGIPTKWAPNDSAGAFFKDSDFDKGAVEAINEAFIKLFCQAAIGGRIVWPADGIGTGLADLANKAPMIWDYLERLKKHLEVASSL